MMKLKMLGLVAISLVSQLADAKSYVWKIEKDGKEAYVGGTIHLLKASDKPLPKEYQQAYTKADMLVFETDMSRLESPEVMGLMQSKMIYQNGQSLKTVLSPEVYQAFTEAATGMGLPAEQLSMVKASMVATQLSMMKYMSQGYTPEGVDKVYEDMAKKDNKPVGKLETVEEQLDFILSMADGVEDEFMKSTLEQLGNDQYMDKLVSYVLSGDVESVNKEIIAPLKEMRPAYEKLLVIRNQAWVPQLEAMITTPEVEFVLVGAAHLWGEDGVLTKLKEKGYAITQL